MCVWCVLEWIFVCKTNKEIFLQPSLIISQQTNRLYMKTDSTLLIYTNKQRFSPVLIWSVQSGRRSIVFFLSFRFQTCCSCFNYILLSINSRKTFRKVLKTSSFAIVRNHYCSQKYVPGKKPIRGRSGARNCELPPTAFPGVENRPLGKKKIPNPRGMPGGGDANRSKWTMH